MVLSFTFRSVIFFFSEIIFVKVLRCLSGFFLVFSAWGCLVFKYHLLKTLFFLHCIAFIPLVKDYLTVYVDVLLSAIFHSVDLFAYYFANTTWY